MRHLEKDYELFFNTRWLHSKTGNLYDITGVCMIESTWRPGFIYVSLKDGISIVRDTEEFLDGRFVEVDKPRVTYNIKEKLWELPREIPLIPTGDRGVVHELRLQDYLTKQNGEQENGEEDLGRSDDQPVPPTVA